MMTIEADSYRIDFEEPSATVTFSGTLRLQGREEYRSISDLLREAAERADSALTLDMRELQFLNSSGISTLSLFVIEMRKLQQSLRIIGSSAISWQVKSIHNFKRLYESAQVVIV